MRDMWFERTLVLLCQHDEDGALGVVINRIGPVTIEEVFERLQEDHSFAPQKLNFQLLRATLLLAATYL